MTTPAQTHVGTAEEPALTGPQHCNLHAAALYEAAVRRNEGTVAHVILPAAPNDLIPSADKSTEKAPMANI